MPNVKISFVVPVFNKKEHIRDCLNSLISQDMDDIEIIVINDGSTDNTLEILEEYKDKINEFITFITKSDFSVVNGYHESWEYIKQDLHSLERNTNFGLYFLTNAECIDK